MRDRDKQIIKRSALSGDTVEIVLPIIHMNGNSRQSLLDEIQEAITALTEGLHRLAEMAPNGRNYYPAPGLLELAQAQHQQRLRALRTILKDLKYEAIGISDDDFNGDEP